MLNLDKVHPTQFLAAHDIEELLEKDFRGTASLHKISVHKSSLLEELVKLDGTIEIVTRRNWGNQRTVLKGQPDKVRAVLKLYLATVLGSASIA
jgi:hypothetical protein